MTDTFRKTKLNIRFGNMFGAIHKTFVLKIISQIKSIFSLNLIRRVILEPAIIFPILYRYDRIIK